MGTGTSVYTSTRRQTLKSDNIFYFKCFALFPNCSQSIHGETERHQPQLQAVVDLAEALKAVLRGHGGLVDDKVSLLHCNWIAVTSRAEEWLNLLLVRSRTE